MPPRDVDAAIGRRIAEGLPAQLGYSDPMPVKIRKQTGIEVISIGRAHRSILITIEQKAGDELRYTYREHSRNRCVFACPGSVTDAHELALRGASLNALADPGFNIEDVTLAKIKACDDGWIEALVVPAWQAI